MSLSFGQSASSAGISLSWLLDRSSVCEGDRTHQIPSSGLLLGHERPPRPTLIDRLPCISNTIHAMLAPAPVPSMDTWTVH